MCSPLVHIFRVDQEGGQEGEQSKRYMYVLMLVMFRKTTMEYICRALASKIKPNHGQATSSPELSINSTP